ncbi:helix-turn-helix domain-containing protein [Levilactobacillus namurensis]|uniref:helix-turn-helix domain-containing protein n=1 Tax=Levilactobacillus namurensis TaxID=380393 RepID=UPI002232B2D3|nr:helix-turn-helix domain-containing protein [Levilactobacillus namurensis]MCW3779514.1 helix-turn-helix domain-containing protein [Levilactobacillus namurensis]MDT7017795.1 helix-turn-helix domain-containing protein [Levilactobacillus namurensis]WNN65204.1 helix-turn-helix domain-containing protein [Levilactobacillus namurensis]
MKIDFAMLTPKATRKIRLLTFINDQGGHFNLADFATDTSESYSQAYHVLLNLRADLLELAPATKLTKDHLETDVTPDAYRHWLYVNSIPYQAILTTLASPEKRAQDVCAQHQISLSTFNRRMRPMREQLAQYQLELTTNPLQLTGNEALIQLLYLTLFTTTMTTLAELPKVPLQYRPLATAIRTTYTGSQLYCDSPGLAQHRELLITISLLRLAQGHRYAPLRLPLAHLTDLRELARNFQLQLGDSPKKVLTQLATLDYLLTSSPYFVRALRPDSLKRLYRGLQQRVGDYQLAPGVVELTDYAEGRNWFANWLFALCQFMMLFRVDPLLRPEITTLYRATKESTAAAAALTTSMARLYPQLITSSDLRLVQGYLSKYTNGLNLTAAKVEILVSYDMVGVTTDVFNRLLGGIVHLQILCDQLAIDPQRRANYLVIYGVDDLAYQFAQEHHLETFHWIKELEYGENLDRLIKTLRHHDLSLFALDFQHSD